MWYKKTAVYTISLIMVICLGQYVQYLRVKGLTNHHFLDWNCYIDRGQGFEIVWLMNYDFWCLSLFMNIGLWKE